MSDSIKDKITVKIDDQDREIFMSFGLLNDLATLTGDPARVAAIPLIADLRMSVLNTVLAPRRKNGKKEAEIDVTELDISIEDAERLLTWASEHVMSFFVRALQKVEKVSAHHKEALAGLVSSLGGSND